MDHVKEIDELNKTLKETGPAERDNWFKSQSNKLREDSGSSFALRFVKHKLDKEFLRAVILNVNEDEGETRIGDLEYFLNRLVRPPHGSR